MIDASRLSEAINQGVTAIRSAQQADGSFLTYTSRRPDAFDGATTSTTTFVTAQILATLNVLDDGGMGVADIRTAAANWLMAQRGQHWTFNYWPRDSNQARTHPYPDDLDDTCCALAALQQYRAELVSPEALARVIQQLTTCEVAVGGPYYTWLVPTAAASVWRDVDVAVNSNVGYFLGLQGVMLPQLEQLINMAIRQGRYTTPYYAPSPYPVMYFMARFYRGPELEKLQDDIRQGRDQGGWWGNPLDSALAVLALLELGVTADELEPTMEQLLDLAQTERHRPQAVYIELNGKDGTYYAGASALTAAWVTQALVGYQRAIVQHNAAADAAPDLAAPLYAAVLTRVRTRLGTVDSELGEQAAVALERQLRRDGDRQIVLLPYFWEQAMAPRAHPIAPSLLEDLGAASLYGWMAYTIYDDILDGEGQLAQLSVANLALRELTNLLLNARPGDLVMATLTTEIMDQLDAANTWEILHCRAVLDRDRLSLPVVPDFADYGRLANRSLGHALGPLCLTLSRGWAIDSLAVRQTMRFFVHYLIARQLNDDAHDWEADLCRGQINAVTALLLHGSPSGASGLERQPLRPLIARLKRQLWQHDIVAVSERILSHIEAAQAALRENPALISTVQLASMLAPLEDSARTALAERERAQTFIAAYQAAPSKKHRR